MSYTLIQQLNPQHAHLTFQGQFQGKPVTGNTHLFTLVEYARLNNSVTDTARQFISIEEMKENDTTTMNLQVALNVAEIDSPTIQKMMIMIRQYKKLSTGRHEYGEEILLNQQQEDIS